MAQWVKDPVLSLPQLGSLLQCDSIPGPETSTCCRCGQKIIKKKNLQNRQVEISMLTTGYASL